MVRNHPQRRRDWLGAFCGLMLAVGMMAGLTYCGEQHRPIVISDAPLSPGEILAEVPIKIAPKPHQVKAHVVHHVVPHKRRNVVPHRHVAHHLRHHLHHLVHHRVIRIGACVPFFCF